MFLRYCWQDLHGLGVSFVVFIQGMRSFRTSLPRKVGELSLQPFTIPPSTYSARSYVLLAELLGAAVAIYHENNWAVTP